MSDNSTSSHRTISPSSLPPAIAPIEVNATEVAFYRDRDSLAAAMYSLGRQASVALALRALNRIGVLVELRNAFLEAIAAGFDVEHCDWYRRTAYAGFPAYPSSAEAIAGAAALSADADPNAGTTLWNATSLDFARLKKLASLENAPPLSGWDDPRLGPLWPEGAPDWHKKAEQQLRELKQKLANRPDSANLRLNLE